MIVLAIDPGSERSALVEVEVLMKRLAVVGLMLEPNPMVLDYLIGVPSRRGLMAIEVPRARGMPASNELFATCVWAGRFIEALDPIEHTCVDRHQVKLAICGDARAKDSNIRAALIDRWGGSKAKAVGTKKAPGPLYGIKADLWAALAVAETYIERELGITDPVRGRKGD